MSVLSLQFDRVKFLCTRHVLKLMSKISFCFQLSLDNLVVYFDTIVLYKCVKRRDYFQNHIVIQMSETIANFHFCMETFYGYQLFCLSFFFFFSFFFIDDIQHLNR